MKYCGFCVWLLFLFCYFVSSSSKVGLLRKYIWDGRLAFLYSQPANAYTNLMVYIYKKKKNIHNYLENEAQSKYLH